MTWTMCIIWRAECGNAEEISIDWYDVHRECFDKNNTLMNWKGMAEKENSVAVSRYHTLQRNEGCQCHLFKNLECFFPYQCLTVSGYYHCDSQVLSFKDFHCSFSFLHGANCDHEAFIGWVSVRKNVLALQNFLQAKKKYWSVADPQLVPFDSHDTPN